MSATPSNKPDSIVIIPTYQESENVVRMIEAVLALPFPFHLLIVDDNSPDGTASLVKEQQKRFPNRLFLLQRPGKQGLGTAYIAGFRWGLEREYEYFFEMDCDFSHHPADLVRLRQAATNYDLVIGSRYVRGGKIANWPWDRKLLSFGASIYVRLITWMPVKDPTAGFVCFKRRVLERINLDKIRFIGYAFQIEMKYTTWKLGFQIKEIPITFIDRLEGVSKMTKGIVREAIKGVIQIRFDHLFSAGTPKDTSPSVQLSSKEVNGDRSS